MRGRTDSGRITRLRAWCNPHFSNSFVVQSRFVWFAAVSLGIPAAVIGFGEA